MPYVLAVLGLLLLGYAGWLFVNVRRGRPIPGSAYLVLALLNGLLVAALLVWMIAAR
ncbi:hypothetical protein V6U90_01865 [Micromonospora sp. CPCC 206060]|uniref:hypothetical protein n=1 Tax=Micromonospora TaxID=1873 RepID=UPI001AD79CE5|nr:hypothetical protein [Micromonospora echinofusca]